LVSGRRPFNPESPYELLDMQREGVRIKPADLRPSLSDAAQKLILQALSFEQTERPQNAKDFGEELARALLNDVVSTRATASSAELSMQTLTEVATNRTLAATVISGQSHLKVLLLYRNGSEPDEHVLKLIQSELHEQGHEVFVDQELTVDVHEAGHQGPAHFSSVTFREIVQRNFNLETLHAPGGHVEPDAFLQNSHKISLGCFSSELPQNRHPERSASQTYRVIQRLVARSRRACPERSRRNPGDAYLVLLFAPFQPPKPAPADRQGLSPAPRTKLARL